jgi:hypothetical protein
MRIKDIPHDDLQALFDNAAPRTAGGTTVRSRRSKERRRFKSNDGRRMRSKGRDKQYRTDVTTDLSERVDDMLDRYDLTKADFTEMALEAAIVLLKSGGIEALQQQAEGSDDK